MNHLLNKDWEYVLHIYEEEMKGSTGWGRGEGHAKLMVSQTHCIKPGAASPEHGGPHADCGELWPCSSRLVGTGGFVMLLKWPHHPCSGFMIRDICRVWRVRLLSGLQLTSVKPSLSSRRHLQRILMNAHPSPGQGHIPSVNFSMQKAVMTWKRSCREEK